MTSGPRYLLSLFAVAAAVGVPLLIAGLGADRVESRAASAGATPRAVVAGLPRIARGVEAVRGLRYDSLPKPRIVDPAQLQRAFAREQGRDEHPAQEKASVAALSLLGLLPPNFDIDRASAAIASDIAGAYDPANGRLYILREPSLRNPALVEFVLSHELDHALEDQRFGLPDLEGLSDDRALAEQALVEGSATEAMILYAARFIDLADLLKATQEPALLQGDRFGELPDLIKAEENFAYLGGRKFVDSLRDLGREWSLVNIALRGRPPLSTAQVMHPFKYLSYERPQPVAVNPGRVLGSGWRQLGGGVLGEFDSLQMLRAGNDVRVARRAAAGWAGQRLEIWRRGSAPCELPCRARDALVAAWRWEHRVDVLQFSRAMRAYLRELGAKPTEGTGVWSLRGGSVALASAGLRTTVAFAPRARLAGRLAAAG